MIIHTQYTGWHQNDFNVHAYGGTLALMVAPTSEGRRGEGEGWFLVRLLICQSQDLRV
jgi:hypothetical protein